MSLSEEQKAPSGEGSPCALAPTVGLHETSEWSRGDFRRGLVKVGVSNHGSYIYSHPRTNELLLSLGSTSLSGIAECFAMHLGNEAHSHTSSDSPSGARFKCDY